MISAARNIILKNPSVKKVIILDKIPRFDPPNTDPNRLKPKLSEQANKILREELKNCDVKDKIVIGKHSLPNQLQKNLYGDPAHQNFDGIHLLGPDGKNHFTRSVCNILQSVMVSHSREPHYHVIPNATPQPCSTPWPSASSSVTSLNSLVTPNQQPRLPDHVVIDIESENTNDEEYTLYTIPVSNSFAVLGN